MGLNRGEVLPKSVMYPDDPIYNKLSQSQIDEIYWQKYKIAEKVNPQLILEIGVRTGYSGYSFLQAVPEAIYIGFDCCDPRQAGSIDYIAHADAILKPYKKALFFRDTYMLESLVFKYVDLVSVDGNHSYNYAFHDLELSFEAVRDGGYILVDDTSYIKSVKQAVDDFLNKHNGSKEHIIIDEIVHGIRGYMLLKVQK